MVKKVYIAGPMRNCHLLNFDNFRLAAKLLRSFGYEVVNPVELDEKDGYNEYTDLEVLTSKEITRRFILRDILAVYECDCIFMLPGWEKSIGANAEYAVAKWLELEFIYEGDEELKAMLEPVWV